MERVVQDSYSLAIRYLVRLEEIVKVMSDQMAFVKIV